MGDQKMKTALNIEMKRCKRQLINQIRREEHEDKLNFYNNLTNQIQKHFSVLLEKKSLLK